VPPAVTTARIARDVVTVSGPDAVTYLQGQLSQDVAALGVGDAAWSFVLQPQGKVDTWMRVDRAGPETFRLDTDPGAGAGLVARLERFKLRTKVDMALTPDVPVLAVRGAEVLDGVPCGWPGVVGSDVFDADPSALPTDLPVDAVAVDAGAYDEQRIRAGVPAMGAEATEDTIPAELGQWVIDASVSFTKGCYTGQELVARIDSRGGNVPRHLRGLVGPGLAVGAPVEVGDREVGVVTSASGEVGLAFLHRSVEVPADVTVGGSSVSAVAVPIA
jgi:tRNA-modifying protein YgfZ